MTVNSNLLVSGVAIIQNATILSNLYISNIAYLYGALTVLSNLNISNNSICQGSVTVNNNLTVLGNSNIDNAYISNNLNVSGNTILYNATINTLTVSNTTILFNIFKKFSSENYHNSIVKKYQNVNIATNSVVFSYFNIIRETCISAYKSISICR